MEFPSSTFPHIPTCDIEALGDLVAPRPMIQTDHDVQTWQRSESYLHLLLYIRRLGDSVVGTELRTAPKDGNHEGGIGSILRLLEELESWMNDIPPQVSPQRYGNLAFRDWGQRLEERCESLLDSKLPSNLHKAVPFLKPYLLTSFGSFIRIDYGTGHELSFVVFLLCLHKLGFLAGEPEVDRSTVLDIFVKYLDVCWKLQDTYKLEPAGSHGVWGLDDYSFLGYYWGSAQLKGKHTPSMFQHCLITTTIRESERESFQRAPGSSPNSPFRVVYTFHRAGQINQVWLIPRAFTTTIFDCVLGSGLEQGELGPSQNAEVLSKRVVVQHLPLGQPLMPFSNHQPQSPTAFPSTPSPQHTPTQTSRITISSSLRGTNLLPPLRQGIRPSSTATPGLTSPFAAPSGGAKFTVSRAAGRGNIPGAMGLREVGAPLTSTSMGPPSVPARHNMFQSSVKGGDEANVENGSSDRKNQVGEGKN
ncbi:unnamed protein product [Rhizoctonia solani]|uniref:Serine/threonine-protein phosphatase 2A activator n=1 Tax=Rhizoctonia solani TaxID=456999 RepID=A0A8H3D785_9AGAM|nr:unnamed protein product [Rhizoctonia solani]